MLYRYVYYMFMALWPSAASLGGVFFFDKNGVLIPFFDLLFLAWEGSKTWENIWDTYGTYI